MQVFVTRPSELGPEEISMWRTMQEQTVSLSNPFLSPEFAIAVDCFRPNVRVAVLADGQTIVGFFPFERRRFGTGVPIGAGLTDCQGLIHAPMANWDPRELLQACKLVEWQFDHLVQGQVPFQCHVSATSFSPVIDLTDGFAAYLEKIRKNSPRFGKDIAYKMRRIEREIGHLSFTIDSHNVSALRMLINWKSDQYRRNGEVDVFARRWICDLIYRLFDTRNEHFNGLLSVLYAGEIPIAAHFGIRSGQILAHWFPAYNVQFSKRSPGLIQHLRMAEEVTTLGVKAIDMGTGAERYKQTLKSYDLPVTEGVIVRGKLSASTHQLRIAQVNRARRLIRRHSTFFRLADWILRHYGRINLSALSASVLHAGKPGKASIKDRVHDH